MKMAQAVAHTDDCSGCFWFVLISLVSFFYSRRRIKADGADDSVSLHDDAGYDGGGIIKGALSPSQIEEYLSRGVLVVPGVLSPEEVQAARRGFHASLANHGVCAIHMCSCTLSASNVSAYGSGRRARFAANRFESVETVLDEWFRRYFGYVLRRLEVKS